MELGLHLTGRVTNGTLGDSREEAREWLVAAETWIRGRCPGMVTHAAHGDDVYGRPELRITLYPGAPAVIIAARGGDRMAITASTTRTGPGYHAFLCDLFERMRPASGITWDEPGAGDTTGYLRSRDKAGLQRTFREAFHAAAMDALIEIEEHDRAASLLLPEGETYTFEGAVATPFGPRSRTWLEYAIDHPEMGQEVTPWWTPGFDVGYALGRALTQMWTDVRWRTPASQDERAQLHEIAALLAHAHRKNPTLNLPWSEWKEINDLLGIVGEIASTVARKAEKRPSARPIGYRRLPVRVALPGGWSMRIPGSFGTGWEGPSTWTGWDDGRTVWFSPLRDEGRRDAPLALNLATAMSGEIRDLPIERIRGSAVLDSDTEGGVTVWRLSARCAVGEELAVITICFTEERDRDWALQTWESIRHVDAPMAERQEERPVPMQQPMVAMLD